jgi:RNA polymerase sigma factor (TIGR02999 family)
MSTSPAHLSPPGAEFGVSGALAERLPQFYPQLRRLARSRLAAGGRYTLLDTTALVHESFLRLQRANHGVVDEAQHFLAYAASTMRSVIVDYVRNRKAARRGGGAANVTLNTGHAEQFRAPDDEILDVHDALEVLSTVDARLAQVVEMRYFGGLTDLEIGEALGVADRTVRRDWERARLLLAALLGR